MIELTTGVIFLMSSLYGSGQGDTHAQNITAQVPADTTTTEVRSFTDVNSINDPKTMEAYLRKEYADTPILVDVARCESNFRQVDAEGNTIRGRVNANDVGVMQINEKYHAAMAKKLGIDIYSVTGNVEYAKHLYKESGTAPWSASAPCWSKSDLAKK